MLMHESLTLPAGPMAVGIDIASVDSVAQSLETFGDVYVNRLFREAEAAYARSVPAQAAQRLAARFAAKEAAVKAFDLADAGVNMRDIEVVRLDSGACSLRLHGRVARLVRQKGFGHTAVCLSHDGGYAAAVVTALRLPEPDSPPMVDS